MTEDKEIKAMMAIAKALDVFKDDDKVVVDRILRWAGDRYSVRDIDLHSVDKAKEDDRSDETKPENDIEFQDIASFYDAVNPKTDVERALIAGYWLHIGEEKPEFVSQDANNHLKNLGHGLKNITDSLNSLQRKKPSLVMQTAKSGKSKQARKKYKLTVAGHSAVKAMLSKPEDTG